MLVQTEAVGLVPADSEEKARISKILDAAYGLAHSSDSIEKFLEKTASSNVFRVILDSGEKIVVKESFWHQSSGGADPARSLRKAYQVSELLRKKRVNLPLVYRTKSGELVQANEKEKIAVLEFLDGSHFSSEDWEFSAAGAALGEFHKAGVEILDDDPDEYGAILNSIPVEKPYEESRKIYFSGFRERLLASHECEFPEVCESVRENMEFIDEAIEYIDASGVSGDSRRRGILHNDFGTNNTLSDSSKKKAYFLDVDQLGVGPLVWDLGNTLASYASNYFSKKRDYDFESRARLFLKAYNSISALPMDEYLLIPAATQRWDVMRILRTMRRHHYENDRLPDLIPKVSERFIPRIKKMPEILSFFTKEWLAAII